MMAQNKQHLLHELLKEDQEPFLLKNYISHRRNQLKRPSQKPTLQVKKQKPPLQPPPTTTTTTTVHKKNSNNNNFLCRNACFLGTTTKSPLFELAKSPCRSPSNAIFLQIPAKTASRLLDAALRIQKNQSKTKLPTNKNSFALLGSFFKRLTQRGKTRRAEIEGSNRNNVKVSVKDLLRWDSSNNRKGSTGVDEKLKKENGFVVACSCDGRASSAVWSEKSMEMEDGEEEEETSTSCCGGHSCEKENADCDCGFDDDRAFFCQSPFRFVLEKCPSVASSSGHRTPEFASPAASPSRLGTQDKENNVANGVNEFQSEEEEKEQCSPVSILETPFEDDDDYDGHENDEEDGGYDLECSYANVQRTKQHLLDRLSRFEKLAELDPIELEKRMLDQEDEFVTYSEEDDDGEISCDEKTPEDLKRLVHDLIMEEERELGSSEDRNMVMRRVCRKLELWREVEPNTIDMMMEEDFSREENGWKKNSEQKRELAAELELAIFCFLVDEVSEELVC